MARAAGFGDDIKGFFKAVEAGNIKSKDVLPKFAEEMKKMAREGGALGAVMGKTRAEMARFLNTLDESKDQLFQNGMDDGLGYMFKQLADTLQTLKPLTKAIGGLFRGAVSVITGALKLIITPLEIVTQVISKMWEMLGGSDQLGTKIWSVIGAGGTLVLLAMRFEFIKKMLFGVNAQLYLMMTRLLRIAAPLLALEDAWGFFNNKDSLTGRTLNSFGGKLGMESTGENALGNKISKDWAWWNLLTTPSMNAMQRRQEASGVTITVNDSEFSKAIEAKLTRKTATTQTEVTQ